MTTKKKSQDLFEYAPVALEENDFSAIKTFLNQLPLVKDEDISTYIDKHPEIIKQGLSLLKIIEVNQAAIEFSQAKDKEEYIARYLETFPESAYETLKKVGIAIYEGQTHMDFEMNIITLTGFKREVLFSFRVLPGHEKTFERVAVSYLDVNEQKHLRQYLEEKIHERMFALQEEILIRQETERKLKFSEKRLQEIAFNSGDIIWETNKDCQYTYITGKVEEFMGYKTEAFLGNSLPDFLSEPNQEYFDACRRQAKETQMPIEDFSFWVTTKQNKRMCLLMNASPLFDEQGNFKGYRGITKNITKQKLAEKESIESEQRYQALTSLSLVGILRLDIQGNIVYINETYCQMVGFDAEHLMKEGLISVVHPDDKQRVGEVLVEAITTHSFAPAIECRLKCRNGKTIWVIGQMALERDDENNPIGFVGATIDITELHEIEERLNIQHQQLIHLERLNAIGEMAFNVADQLNQPLSLITNHVQKCSQLMDKDDYNTDVNHALRNIELHTERTNAVLQRIKSFFSTGRLQKKPEDINEIIEKTVKLMEHRYLQSVTVHLDLVRPSLLLICDRIQIQQVIFNIIQNAIDAIKNTDKSNIKITIKTLQHGNNCEIVISDTGSGMSKDIQSQIFDPFFSTKSNSMGMGLTICRSIIEGHKGEMYVTSTEGRGTRFKIMLPIV